MAFVKVAYLKHFFQVGFLNLILYKNSDLPPATGFEF